MTVAAINTFGDALGSYLKQFIPLRDAMGGPSFSTRIDLDAIPATAKIGRGAPWLVFSEITNPQDRALDGTYINFTRVRWQIDAYAKTAAERAAVAKALRLALRSFRGRWAGHEIRDVQIETDVGTSSAPDDGSGDRDWRQMLEIAVWQKNHEEA